MLKVTKNVVTLKKQIARDETCRKFNFSKLNGVQRIPMYNLTSTLSNIVGKIVY